MDVFPGWQVRHASYRRARGRYDSIVDVLGVHRTTVALWDGDPRLTSGSTELAVWEWVINDVPLSSMFDAGSCLPLLYDNSIDGPEALHRLRGDLTDRPVFVRRFQRSRADRFFRREGTPWAPSGPAFEDGRVCLLQCPCGDLDCGALTTEVVISDQTVEWRDIGWQVTYEPFADFNEILHTATFDRQAYTSLIDQLLAGDLPDIG